MKPPKPSRKTMPIRIRLSGDPGSRRVMLNGSELLPDRSQKIRNHSPDGFSWGYHGSGCAQLALAIMLETVGEYKAKLYYQDFKRMFLAPLDMDADLDMDIEIPEQWVDRCTHCGEPYDRDDVRRRFGYKSWAVLNHLCGDSDCYMEWRGKI